MKGMKQEEDLLVTYRPDGKKGVVITKGHYETLSTFILSLLDEENDQSLQTILHRAQNELVDSIDSDVAWFLLQVKLDLEAREFIRSVVAPYNKRVFLLKITRLGQRKLRELKAERSLGEVSH